MTDAIRVLMLNDDNRTLSYHSEDTTCWRDTNAFIKWLTHAGSVPQYEVRQVYLTDLDIDGDTIFDIIYWEGRGYSFEEYQEAFNFL